MLRIIYFLAYHTLSKNELDRRWRRYCAGWDFRYLGIDWGDK